jgi:hypothetical protein
MKNNNSKLLKFTKYVILISKWWEIIVSITTGLPHLPTDTLPNVVFNDNQQLKGSELSDSIRICVCSGFGYHQVSHP